MGTTSSFFGGGGGGGDPQANFKASTNINANDLVVLNSNGTIGPMTSVSSTSSAGSAQDAGTGACSNVISHGHYDEVAGIAVNIYKRSGQWMIKAASNSGGTLTYGSEVSTGITPPGDAESCCRITYDTINQVYVAWGNSSSNSLYFRSFTVSGNTITLIGSPVFMYYYFWKRFDCLYLPDVQTHVVMGCSNSQYTRFVNVNTAANGVATSPYAGNANPPYASFLPTTQQQSASITDMGNGLVGCVRDSGTQGTRAFFKGTAGPSGTSFTLINTTDIQLGFGGPTADASYIIADKINKKIIYIITAGSSDCYFRVFSFEEFLSAATYTSSIASSLGNFSESAIIGGGEANALGEIFVYFSDGKNVIHRFNIGEGFITNQTSTESPSGDAITKTGHAISPSNFSPEAWLLGLNTTTDAAQARNFTFSGINTNVGSFLGTAPEAISSGSLGKVNLTNRDLTSISVKSLSPLISGQSYFENSSGLLLGTTGSNLVGFGSDGGLKVIGAPV